ncbi:MAG: HU family DNA-binding protein [Paludibacteraceae bacterium]|nr:HU family DNA-binding protein [Paludibacteraceae bacterium]
MNKTELISAMAEKAELTKVDAKRALDAMIEAIGEQMEKGESVSLLGFGTFMVVERPERQGLNPATKEKITIPARKAVKFKVGGTLAEKVK